VSTLQIRSTHSSSDPIRPSISVWTAIEPFWHGFDGPTVTLDAVSNTSIMTLALSGRDVGWCEVDLRSYVQRANAELTGSGASDRWLDIGRDSRPAPKG